MMQKKAFAVLYMFILTAFFSAILIGISRGTRQRVMANERLAFEKAVLNVFPDLHYFSDQEAHALFEEKFQPSPQAGGAYVYTRDGSIAGYAVPISGKGFWAKISGIIGIAPDRKTITGISFYEQSETPGLGARIMEAEFYQQFAGKVMQPGPHPIVFRSPGQELSAGQVHAIAGATQTCVRLELFLNRDLQVWRQAVQEAKP